MPSSKGGNISSHLPKFGLSLAVEGKSTPYPVLPATLLRSSPSYNTRSSSDHTTPPACREYPQTPSPRWPSHPHHQSSTPTQPLHPSPPRPSFPISPLTPFTPISMKPQPLAQHPTRLRHGTFPRLLHPPLSLRTLNTLTTRLSPRPKLHDPRHPIIPTILTLAHPPPPRPPRVCPRRRHLPVGVGAAWRRTRQNVW